MVARLLWECRGGIRDRVRRNAAKPCDTCVCWIFPGCRKRHKSGFDHRNDHRQKKLFSARRGIMAEIEYPGVVQLIERVVWDHEAESLSLSTRTKIPLKSLISEGFFLFFVYCGADDDITPMLLYANTRHTQKYFIAIMPKLRYDTNIKNVELPRLQGIIWAKYYRFPY